MSKNNFDEILRRAFTEKEYRDYARVIKNNVQFWLEEELKDDTEYPWKSREDTFIEILEKLKK